MSTPNDALKVEWFYMSFHQEDRTRYLESRQRLCDETLETIAKYFDNIYNSHGLLTKKREKQIKFCAKRKLRHKITKRYNDKIRNLANQRYGRDDRRHERSYSHHQNYDKKYIHRNHNDHCGHNHPYKRDNKDCKSLPESEDKAFKPCHLHGSKSQHSFEKCFKNPKNQDKKSYDKKRPYEAHHNGKHHASKDEESRASVDSPPPSDNHALLSEDKEQHKEEQYHVHFEKKMKVGSQVAHVPRKKKSIESIVNTTLKKTCPTFLDNDLDLRSDLDLGNDSEDSVLMGLDSLMALDDVMNPFDFK